jgi:hypothetical protein
MPKILCSTSSNCPAPHRIPSLAGQVASANIPADGALRDQGEKGMLCEAVLQIDSRACDRKRIALLPPVQTGGVPLPLP